MPQNDLQSLISQFGIDTRSQQEILAERAKQNYEDAMSDEYQERYPGDAGLQRAGALLGTALGNKFNNKLTEQQQREQDAAKEARSAVSEQVDKGLYLDDDGNVDPVKRAMALEKELAKSLVRQNDQRGIGMLIAIGEREKQADKDALERRSTLLTIGEMEDADRQRDYDWDRRIENERIPVWPIDSTDPNDVVDLYIDRTGNARKLDTMDVVYPAGEWSRIAPIAPEDITAAARGSMTDEQKARMPNKADISAMNRRQRDIFTTMNLGIGITKALKSAVNEDGTLNMMGAGGKVTAGAVSIFDNIMAAGRGLSNVLILTDDADVQTGSIDSKAGARSYVEKNKSFFDSITIPANIDRTDPRAVAQYQAILVQYAYAKARLNEENGRISDKDFEHAITQIAAASTDPEALRRVLVGDVERNINEYDLWVEQIHPTVKHLATTPGSQRMFNEKRVEWEGAFAGSFGSSGAVGEGLLPSEVPIPQAQPDPAGEITVDQLFNGGYNSQEEFFDSFYDETDKETERKEDE